MNQRREERQRGGVGFERLGGAAVGGGARKALNLGEHRRVHFRDGGDDDVHERVQTPAEILVFVFLEAIEEREEFRAARGEEPTVMKAEEQREGEQRFSAKHRAPALEQEHERGEQGGLIVGRERRARARAEIPEPAVEEVQRRLLHFRARIPQAADEQFHPVLVQHRLQNRGFASRRARQSARGGAAQLFVLRPGHDRHQTRRSLGAGEFRRPLPAVRHDVLDHLHRVMLRDFILPRAKHPRHRAHRRGGNLPRGGGGDGGGVRASTAFARVPPRRLRRLVLLRGDVEE